ncbi:calcium-binding protein [Phenylobacterium sp.]|uniref:calcium-binding protein n=1 Tax=Phenylobacterium sp. TaxID=1871053 RepID=UPI002C821461|nr:calcium-binding protein [Phenylobacterium sp.]HLZ75989.1 calcium-binding protein [Phenylobacterium sp.]
MPVISGTAGPDVLVGTSGVDTLVGGLGADTLTGGGGADVFDINTPSESPVTDPPSEHVIDQITDWNSSDFIQIAGSPIATSSNVINYGALTSYQEAVGAAQYHLGTPGIDYLVADIVAYGSAPGELHAVGEYVIDIQDGVAVWLPGAGPESISQLNFGPSPSTAVPYSPPPDTGSDSGDGFDPGAVLTLVTAPVPGLDPNSAASSSGPGDTSGVVNIQATTVATDGDDYLTALSAQTEVHAGAGNDTIAGTIVDDYLRGDDGDDSISGGPVFDDINGNQGNDTLAGNDGDDWVVGGKGDDSQSGGAGNDIVLGNLGNDTLNGGDGADQIRGGQGDDSIVGGAGDDFISGDRGNDTEVGGAGADIFHGSQDAGIDKVLDFNQAEGDRVMLDPGTTYTVSQVGANTVIDMGNGNEMILAGVQLSTLKDGWIFEG